MQSNFIYFSFHYSFLYLSYMCNIHPFSQPQGPGAPGPWKWSDRPTARTVIFRFRWGQRWGLGWTIGASIWSSWWVSSLKTQWNRHYWVPRVSDWHVMFLSFLSGCPARHTRGGPQWNPHSDHACHCFLRFKGQTQFHTYAGRGKTGLGCERQYSVWALCRLW